MARLPRATCGGGMLRQWFVWWERSTEASVYHYDLQISYYVYSLSTEASHGARLPSECKGREAPRVSPTRHRRRARQVFHRGGVAHSFHKYI